MKTPGPDHPISYARAERRVRVRYQDHVIADTAAAVTVQEADYAPVHYFPRGDVETGFLSQTEKTTHCEYKGDATYYSLFVNGDLLENAAWSYEAPYPTAEDIRGLIAFDPQKVEVYTVDEADLADRHATPLAQEWPNRSTT